MRKFASVVFIQNPSEFDEAIAAANAAVAAKIGQKAVEDHPTLYVGTREWCRGLFDYLGQWDMPEAVSDEVFDDGVSLTDLQGGCHAGYGRGTQYVVTWDMSFGHCGLYRAYRPSEA